MPADPTRSRTADDTSASRSIWAGLRHRPRPRSPATQFAPLRVSAAGLPRQDADLGQTIATGSIEYADDCVVPGGGIRGQDDPLAAVYRKRGNQRVEFAVGKALIVDGELAGCTDADGDLGVLDAALFATGLGQFHVQYGLALEGRRHHEENQQQEHHVDQRSQFHGAPAPPGTAPTFEFHDCVSGCRRSTSLAA